MMFSPRALLRKFGGGVVGVMGCVALAAEAMWETGEPLVFLAEDLAAHVFYRSPGELFPEDGPQDQWMGLYDERLALARVAVMPTEPPVVDGFRLDVFPDRPDLLFRDVPRLRVGRVIVSASNLDLTSSEPLRLSLGKKSYTLTLEVTNENTAGCRVVLREGKKTQILYDEPDGDSPQFRVHWAGDLDADGRLDLVATFAKKYSSLPRTLWLSGSASRGALLRGVALFTVEC